MMWVWALKMGSVCGLGWVSGGGAAGLGAESLLGGRLRACSSWGLWTVGM